MQNIKTLRDKFYSGKSSHTESELKKLLSGFNKFLTKTVENGKPDNDFFTSLNDILGNAFRLDIHNELADTINPDTFYKLGKLLLNRESEISVELTKNWLDIFRLPPFLRRVYDDKRWPDLVSQLIEKSNFTVRELFLQRLKTYRDKPLFNVIKGNDIFPLSWKQTANTVNRISGAIAGLINNNPDGRVALLMENSPEMIMVDLACLTSGIVNIMIPANSVPQHIAFILNQSEAETIFVSNEKQLSKIKSIKNEIPHVKNVIIIEGGSSESWVKNYKQFIESYKAESLIKIKERFHKEITPHSMATVMYTSGTTGEPKGIVFSQMNIVFKRFCRAMAIPEIGDEDKFLCYLPLFHTFGRYLEMTGVIFWGAEYYFMENPSAATMIKNMQMVKPSVFISIPKKWFQLHERISEVVDLEFAPEAKIIETIKNVTGGKLKWGLSAAGFLHPDIFRFFQKYGIELMSGFGMTEATGGITMTPPGMYRENSLGKALPGIEIKVADDGELLIKGNYVMTGYLGVESNQVFDEEGFFASGDIMREDEDGFIEIIDRKKEIYKNIKGETIAPQKIENLFKDFDFINQVFLVGDHRAYNTVLIYPDDTSNDAIFASMDKNQRMEYFATVIVTVNKFLPSFERIVDFRIIERPFTAENGELTPKGTFKRRVVEQNFSELINSMYASTSIELVYNDFVVKVPNWFLRENSCLNKDITLDAEGLKIPKQKRFINLTLTDNKVTFGNYVYNVKDNSLDLQKILTNPLYWCGNEKLIEFAGNSLVQWSRVYTLHEDIGIIGYISNKVTQEMRNNLNAIFEAGEISLMGTHAAINLIYNGDISDAKQGLKYLEMLGVNKLSNHYKIVINFFTNPALITELYRKRLMLESALKTVQETNFTEVLGSFVHCGEELFDDEICEMIAEECKNEQLLLYIEDLLESEILKIFNGKKIKDTAVESLLRLISTYGFIHPTTYDHIRQVFVRYQLNGFSKNLAEMSQKYRTIMRNGFRTFLGRNQRIAVDSETGREYKWKDVVIFEESIPDDIKERLLNGISKTAILREAIFLFSGGRLIMLSNIPPGGIWISLWREYHDKSMYRVSIQTRTQGSYDLLLSVNKELSLHNVIEEVNWLILAGSRYFMHELVDDFGGYWENYDIWSAKFVSGDTVKKFFRREQRKKERSYTRLYHLWPFFVWNASAAYFNFWNLTGQNLMLGDTSPDNFIIPTHDYQTGTKVVSFSSRVKAKDIYTLFNNFLEKFVLDTEEKHTFLKRNFICNYIFAGIVNAEGKQQGLFHLKELKKQIEDDVNYPHSAVLSTLERFIETMEDRGFLPKPVYFASKRFHRWYNLNKDASFKAQAEFMQDLYHTYLLAELEKTNLDTRIRFYTETVFSESEPEFKKILKFLIDKLYDGEYTIEDAREVLLNIPSELELTKREKFFLTRLSFPHIKPDDSAVVIQTKNEGSPLNNLVVEYQDYNGNLFFIRKPVSPKEISRLHQLFIEANLLVNFTPEHHFLVAISERGYIIGGLFYSYDDNDTVFMDKIVVNNKYRRQGISEYLMNELFERLKGENIQFVTTGFFRPEYFYRFGFKIEKKYSGLVKDLSIEEKED